MSWSEVDSDNVGVTERIDVPGGWLYRTIVTAREFLDEKGEKGIAIAMVFVPYSEDEV